nr:FAD-linked oxidase C-terminal domain-containing protein [Rubrobacter indicoceani]
MMGLATELERAVPAGRILTDEKELQRRAGGFFTHHLPRLPEVVVVPESKDEVASVLRYASENGIPVTPFGAGSSLEGHTTPVEGGISLDLNGLNNIVEVRPDDFIARVEGGVTRGKLNAALEEHGLFFPVDPGWDATIGGMVGTNASGTNAVRYGVMRDQVLGLEVVLADGSTMHTGGLSMKSSAGYNLTGLFVGSEGTLGVFTEVTLRLYPVPESIRAARAVFPSVEAAARVAVALIQSGMNIGRVELVDARTVEAVNAYRGTDYPVAPTLFLEFSGSEPSVEHDVEVAGRVSSTEGCKGFDFETDEAGRERLWETRHQAGTAVARLNPDKRPMTTDVCVPVSRLPGALVEARKTIDCYGVDGAILGHVGDGNYHAVFPVDAEDPEDFAKAEAVNAEIVAYALARGGTCTGEHGIGSGKAKYLQEEHGDSLDFMRGIKALADPKGIMNPGKVIPL